MEQVSVGSAKKKKHRRAKSNLESQVAISTDHLISGDDDAKVVRTRHQSPARFESFLQDAVAENRLQDSARKKKKKKRTHTADSVLETIKSGSPIAKTASKSEENLIEANLYKEDDSIPGKESKESYQTLLQEEELQENERTPRKSKTRTPKSQASESISTPDKKEKTKRRKTTRTPGKNTNEESGKENLGYENEQNIDPEGTSKPKKSPKRRGDRVRRKLQDGGKSSKKKEEELILSVTIHRADQLKTDIQICHPMLRIHVVDISTGNYVKKSDREKNVASYYENKNDSPVDYIMPVMTQPFDFKTHKCLIPYWEEVLIFNESLSYFTSTQETDPNIIIFFEVVDFLSIAASSRQKGNDKGWYQIAWAFLKVVGGNGNINIDRKVRLQLFHPCRSMFRTKPSDQLEIFYWWNQCRRIPYPSTLYVTLKGVAPPKKIEPALRSMYAIQQEKGRVTFEELTNDAERRAYGVRDNKENDEQAPNWTKLPGQVNRIPNKQLLSLQSGRRGCFVVKFSHNGRYLACGCAEADSFPVIVYEIPSGQCRGQLFGHFSIIYNLSWSADDKELISSSSDGTVRMWDIHSMMTSFVKVFPHPCFVYSAEYHPTTSTIIVTGGYDRLIRVWTSACDGINGQLLREMEGHVGFINCVCFSHQGDQMFSADSTGSIIMWQTVSAKRKKKGPSDYVKSWTMIQQVKEEELMGNVINSLELHPSGLKLLVHTRNSALCMLDLRSSTVVKRYLGASNFKEHIHSTMSTCGSFVFSGSEDGVAYVWNVETGDVVSVYTSLNYENAVSDVDFHPMDHMIVFCSFGNSQPILVYKYDSKAAKNEAKRMLAPSTPTKEVTTPGTVTTADEDKRHLTLGEVTSDIMRLQKVKNKLNSVLETPGATPRILDTAILQTPAETSLHPFQTSTMFQTPNGVAISDNSAMKTFSSRRGPQDTLSTWGSDFTPTGYPTPGQVSGYPISPHSQQHLGASGRFQSLQQFPQTPGAPVVDSPGSPLFRHTLGRDPFAKRGSLSMNFPQDSPGPLHMSHLQQKPTFSFTAGSTIHEHLEQPRKRVVAMYPYDANRADEITIRPGDVITVLYHDNENWWMGELADGSQGYFPSNYVMQQEELESEVEQQEEPSVQSTPKHRKKNSKMTAVTSKTGELRIISGPEDSSDPELSATQSARQRRRQRKSQTSEKTFDTEVKSRGIPEKTQRKSPEKATRRSPKKPSS